MEIKKKKYLVITNMLYILKGIFKYNKILFIFMFVGVLCASLLQFLYIYISKVVIDLITTNVDYSQLLLTLALISLTQLVLSSINIFCESQRWWRFIYVRMKYILLRIKKANTMSYEYLENPEILDLSRLADRATSGNHVGIESMMHNINQVMVNIFKILLSIAILITSNPLLIITVVILSAAYYIVLNITITRDKKYSWDKLAPKWRKISYMSHLTKNFEFAKDMRLYNMKDFIVKKHQEVNKEAHNLVADSKNRWIRFGVFFNCIQALLELVIYAYLIYYVLYQNLSIGDFAFYLATVRSFFGSLNGILYDVASIRRANAEVNDYRTFVELEDKIKSANRNINEIKHFNFEFINVSFKYPKQEQYALKNLNLKLEQGSRLAVVGLNGAGKSTFIKLLLRLYEPTEGEILVDGINIKDFDKTEYYSLFAPLFQNVELFAFPLSVNVSMSSLITTDKNKVYQTLCLAGLDEKVKSLSKGIDTEVLKVLYEDGIDLSGGEKQKLALARALYKDASVIVLDEPTSALDALAEYNLYQQFDNIINDKTAVYISHRLSSTKFCDKIAMFKDGGLIEYGNHHDLMMLNNEYKKMFDLQAQYYQDVEVEVA